MTVDSVTFESDWLPPAELEHLLREQSRDLPDVDVSPSGSVHRGLDPNITVAIVTGLFGVAVPFVTKLVERLFAKQPRSVVTFERPGGTDALVVRMALSVEDRRRIIEEALESGAVRIQIGLGSLDSEG